MTDRPRDLSDDAVRRALADVAATTRPAPDLADRLIVNARAGGPAVVQLAARRHTRWIAPLLAAAVVATLALGGVAIGSTLADEHHPSSTQAPSIVTPSSLDAPTASPTPTSSPRPTRSNPTSRTATPTSPSTRPTSEPARAPLAVAALDDATVDLPSWGSEFDGTQQKCLGGERQFHNGRNALPSNYPAVQSYQEFQGTKAVTDVDGDGAADVVAVLFCGIHQPLGYRVLAFRSKVGGGVEVIGDLTGPLTLSTTQGRLGEPTDAVAGSHGSVVVKWTFGHQTDSPTQDRTYRFTGGHFSQVGGDARFPDPSSDLSVSTARATLHTDHFTASGTVVAVIRNTGPRPTDGVELELSHRGLRIPSAKKDGKLLRINKYNPEQQSIPLPDLAVGASYTVRLRVLVDTRATSPSLTIEGNASPDANYSNNIVRALFVIR